MRAKRLYLRPSYLIGLDWIGCVDRPSSFRVFDREAEGKAYELVNQHFLTGADVNVIGQPKLHFEPQDRHCPKYAHVLHGNVRVGRNFLQCHLYRGK